MDGKNICVACDGTGLLSDDEGWQYHCQMCSGAGNTNPRFKGQPPKVMAVDDNNRLLE